MSFLAQLSFIPAEDGHYESAGRRRPEQTQNMMTNEVSWLLWEDVGVLQKTGGG